MLRIAGLAAFLYAGLLVLVYLFQARLIYFPTRSGEAELIRDASRLGLEPWRNDRGALTGWKGSGAGDGAAHRLVAFHGNASLAADRVCLVRGFESLDGGRQWKVFLFEYPGYGSRPGTAGEAAIQESAGEALEDLLREDDRPVYLLGESLGSAVACRLAARYPEKVAGVILVTPMTSLADVAAHHYTFLPVRLLIRDRHDSVEALRGYRGPVAFVLAGNDEVVPARMGRALHDGYAGPKKLWVEAGAGHNSLSLEGDSPLFGEVSGFLAPTPSSRSSPTNPGASPSG